MIAGHSRLRYFKFMKPVGLIVASLLLCTYSAHAQAPTAAQLFQAALAAQQRGDLNTAIEDYRRALKLAPNLTGAYVNLAAAYMRLNQLDKALANYKVALQQSPSDVKIAVLMGNCLVLQGQYNDAIQLLTPFEKKHPEDLDVAFLLGESLIRVERLQDGLKRIEKVAAGRNDASAWMLAGMTQLKLGENEKAHESLDKGIRLDPNVPGAYTLSGMAKSLAGDEEGAKASFRKALEMDPDDFEANLHLGTILRREGEDLEGARRYIAHCLRLNPTSLAARYQMAQVEAVSGNLEAAASQLEDILREIPNSLEPHVQLSSLYLRLHRPADAQRERKIVDELLSQPQKQDRHLEDRTLGPEKESGQGSTTVPSP